MKGGREGEERGRADSGRSWLGGWMERGEGWVGKEKGSMEGVQRTRGRWGRKKTTWEDTLTRKRKHVWMGEVEDRQEGQADGSVARQLLDRRPVGCLGRDGRA